LKLSPFSAPSEPRAFSQARLVIGSMSIPATVREASNW
jgi:hypothetical protein